MQRVNNNSVRSVGVSQAIGPNMPVPVAVKLDCAKCGDTVAMTPNGHWYRPIVGLYAATYSCPSCQADCKLLFTTGQSDSGWQPEMDSSLSLYQHPAPRYTKSINPDFLNEIFVPKRIGKAYQEALVVLQTSHTASAVHSRRTLEGIAKHFVPDSPRDNLAKLLEQLPTKHDLGQPIMKIADALRAGGNLAAHFDSDEDVTAETAEAMLELLEDLIEFLFVLPHKIDSLQLKLSSSERD